MASDPYFKLSNNKQLTYLREEFKTVSTSLKREQLQDAISTAYALLNLAAFKDPHVNVNWRLFLV